jgi:hypothetical protein
MYTCGQRVYGVEDYLQNVPHEATDICMEQCTTKGPLPCDETVYELWSLLLGEHTRQQADSGEEAVLLYQFLREQIIMVLSWDSVAQEPMELDMCLCTFTGLD